VKRLAALLLAVGLALAWGPKGHELIAAYAVYDMPQGPARTYFAAHLKALKQAANDPDRRKSYTPGEAYRHYWEAERYEPWPFPDFPMPLAAARARFGEATLEQGGILPWAIEESYNALVKALKADDEKAFLKAAGDLAHYVGDAHQPFHTTTDFDGQSWLNGGIHALFESTIIEAYWDDARDYWPKTVGPAREAPLALAFEIFREDHPLVITLNEELWKVKRLYSEFDKRYYKTLWNGLFGLTARVQINRAARRLASLYLRAWNEAKGR